jgi:hypothetical protein
MPLYMEVVIGLIFESLNVVVGGPRWLDME